MSWIQEQGLTVWVTDDLDNLSLPPAADLAVQAVHQVQATTKELPSPSLVTNAVGPEVLFVEGRIGRSSVTDEAAGSMRVHAEQERNEQVVRIPEGLERLLSDPVVGGRVDQQHAKQHDVSGDATSLGVMNLQGNLRPHLSPLYVEEARTVSFPSLLVWYRLT